MTTVGICVQDKTTLNHDDGGREFLEFSEWQTKTRTRENTTKIRTVKPKPWEEQLNLNFWQTWISIDALSKLTKFVLKKDLPVSLNQAILSILQSQLSSILHLKKRGSTKSSRCEQAQFHDEMNGWASWTQSWLCVNMVLETVGHSQKCEV